MSFFKKNIDNLIILFLSLFIIGFLNEHITAIKNIGIYGALFFSLVKIFYFKYNIFKKNLFKDFLFLSTVFLIFIMFISTFNSYHDSLYGLKKLIKEIKYPIFFLIAFSSIEIKNKNQLLKYFNILFFSFVIAILCQVYHYLKLSLINFDSIENFKIKRSYSSFYDISFPFLFTYFLINKNKIIKISLFLLLAISIIILFFTGARGSWLTVLIEMLFILYLYFSYRNFSFIKRIKIGIISILLIGISLFALYNNSHIIKRKINQGLDSSGRNYIIEDRLPVFLKHGNLLLGIGYGTKQYQKFMNDYNVTKRVGKYNNRNFIYFHDEPTLLSFFYHHGIIGFSILILIFIYIFLNFIKIIKRQKIDLINFYISTIFVSIFGFYLIRGLFEFIHIKYLLFLLFFYIILKKGIEKSYVENSIHLS